MKKGKKKNHETAPEFQIWVNGEGVQGGRMQWEQEPEQTTGTTHRMWKSRVLSDEASE